MYICNNCGLVFDRPKNLSEDYTPGGIFEGGSFIYHYSACPSCGGDYEEATECQRCGEYCNDNFCKSCIADIKKEYAKLVADNFTESEYDTILDCITNPYSDNPYWEKGLVRAKAKRTEKYLMSFLNKYIQLMKDNFREDEYDYTEDVEIDFKEV